MIQSELVFLGILILAAPLALFMLYVHVAYVRDHLRTKNYEKFFLVAFALFVTFVLGVKFEFQQGTFIVVWAVMAMTFYLVNALARSLFYNDVKRILKKI